MTSSESALQNIQTNRYIYLPGARFKIKMSLIQLLWRRAVMPKPGEMNRLPGVYRSVC